MMSKCSKFKSDYFKIYHLTFDEESILHFVLRGSYLKKDNGIGGQKGGMFFWTNHQGVNFWLNRLLSCEKASLESGIVQVKRVPSKVYIMEFLIPQKNFSSACWQIDPALSGKYFIPLIAKYCYKLYKKRLMSDKEISLYLNCPLGHDKKYLKKITGLMLSKGNIKLKTDNPDELMALKTLSNYSSSYAGVIQRLHDFLYLKSKGYMLEYNSLLKHMLSKREVCSIKYCGVENLKPVSIEVWDTRTRGVILGSTDLQTFVQNVKTTRSLKTNSSDKTKREREN